MARVGLKSVAFALLVASFFCGVASQSTCIPGLCPKPPSCPRTWNYPEAASWGSLCQPWMTCSTGLQQSPINVVPPVLPPACAVPHYDIRYTVSQLTLFNTGNYLTTPVSKQTGNTFNYNGVQYILKQLIFHTPSEHTVNGVRYDLEIQFVHDSPFITRELVASVFFNQGNVTNPFLEQIIYDVPQFSDCTCGNGRLESVLGNPLIVGVAEACDDGVNNTNEPWTVALRPTCCRPTCVLAYCGDGIVDQGEACDNGALNSWKPGACRPTCCLPACGDHVTDPGEQCDDGNRFNLDGCSSICLNECGDGQLNTINGTEQCDSGANNSNTVSNACRLNCKIHSCGDYVIDTGETCDGTIGAIELYTTTDYAVPDINQPVLPNQGADFDWPNGINPSQCRAGCKVASCGDGITDLNEDCDLGTGHALPVNGNSSRCGINCKTNCGDGIVEPGEACDLGPANSNHPDSLCRTTCQKPYCGDGIVDVLAGEQCDSIYLDSTGAPVPNLYCSATCQQVCGSGVPDFLMDKQCDQGCYNANIPNRCRTNCRNPICGDDITDVTEQCDHGSLNSNSVANACRVNCSLPRCGDGVIDSGETCDDGPLNGVPGSGCDISCRLTCGNGILDSGEQCDLGALNANVPNTCRTDCMLPYCGDGIVDTCEQCDQGTSNSDTTPNACRLDCTLPYCGDGIIDTKYGEKCDLGSEFNSDLTFNGCSAFCIPNYCRQHQVRNATDLSLALPPSFVSYAYPGSVASPPCTQDVDYLIFPAAQLMSTHQYNAFAGVPHGLPGSNRPLQTLGTRQVSFPCVPLPPVCGNGVQEAGEHCDLGYLINSDWEANVCRTTCQLPFCGDGVTDTGEECDAGPVGSPSCSTACILLPALVNPFQCPPWGYGSNAAGCCSGVSPCKWASSCPIYNLCDGTRAAARQSPININTSTVVSAGGAPAFSLPAYSYSTSTINFVNSGRSLGLLIGPGQTLGGLTLVRIEFHTPSEHTINGVHSDLEAQLLHTNQDGSQWIGVSLLFNKGNGMTSSSFLSQFEFYVPRVCACAHNNGLVEAYIGEQCDDGQFINSDSRPNTCRRNGALPRCGDGVVDRGEQCDKGVNNSAAPNSCKPNTCLLPYCGDGYIDLGEQCDFAMAGGRPCTTACTLLCGNGLIDGVEVCDNGPLNSDVTPNACRTTCVPAHCGDNVIDSSEVCDNGNLDSNTTSNACRLNCRLPFCGDGVTDPEFDEQCDNGVNNSFTNPCLPNCQLSCGTGVMVPGTYKQCDNGTGNSNTNGAFCRTDCTLPRCGDSVLDLDLGEQCDDGPLNGLPIDGAIRCSTSCQIICGNGVTDLPAGETCDNGVNNDDTTPGACRTNCKVHSCGDGVRDPFEECDFGPQNSNLPGNSPCRSTCVLPRMGDGIVDTCCEQCDDGNLVNGDGCSNTGLWECGNGRRDGNEMCDNGALNSVLPNSCRPQGFSVGGVNLGCTDPRCGDGIVDDGEQCDQGSLNGNAPNHCRADCTLPYCGDDIVDNLYGELCDDGLTTPSPNNDFNPSGCSTTCQPNVCRSCSAGTLTFSLAEVFNTASPVATYTGSLTTPPCTEVATWYVLTKPYAISTSQLEGIVGHLCPGGNSRGVQPLNGRTVSWTANAPPVCGNCILETGEQCDAGESNANLPDQCRTNCQKPKCGDDTTDTGEQCDEGTNNAVNGYCNLQCKINPPCPASCTGPTCASCYRTSAPSSAPEATCNSVTTMNNSPSGTVINVAFADILAGAGCSGPTCQQT